MDNIHEFTSLLANSFRVPALLVEYGGIKLSIPEDYRTAVMIAEEKPAPGILPPACRPGVAHYLSSSFKECFIYLNIHPGHELWLGPILTEPIPEDRVSELIRRHKSTLRKKKALVEYYAALPVLSEEQYYYMGRLSELLHAQFHHDAPSSAFRREEAQDTVFSARRDAEERFELFQHPPYFMELEMTRLVTSGDMESALKTMNRINAFQRAVLAGNSVRSLKNSLICDCTFLARAAIAGGAPPEDAFATSDRLILRIEEAGAISELERLERENLIEFVSLVHIYNTAHYSKPVRDAIGYINRNLGEKITLQVLSEFVGLHPRYLCSIFKKETADSISVYILNRRIEEAKYFLRYTDNPISDIANFYQFSSQSHFTRRFSQIAGMTPLQYRKKMGTLLTDNSAGNIRIQ